MSTEGLNATMDRKAATARQAINTLLDTLGLDPDRVGEVHITGDRITIVHLAEPIGVVKDDSERRGEWNMAARTISLYGPDAEE